MQQKYFSFLLCLFVSLTLDAQQWNWAKTINGPNVHSREVGTAVSPTGDIYLAFSYIDSNYGLPFGGLIVKFDGIGNELWRKSFSQPVTIESIVCDATGNLAVCGLYRDTLPSAFGGFVSTGGNDGFLALLTPNFIPLWSQNFKGSGDEMFADLALDNQGNFIVAGSFEKSCVLGNYLLSTQGAGASIITRISLTGQVLQAFATDSPDTVSANGGQKIRCDSSGRIHLLGSFRYRVSLDTMVRSSTGYEGVSQFLACFDANGQGLYLTKAIDATSNFKSLSVTDSLVCLTGDGGWTTSGWQMTHAFNNDGSRKWQKQHSGFYFDYSANCVAEQNGEFYSVGQVTDPNVPQWTNSYSLTIRQFDVAGQENIITIPCSGGGDIRKICPLGNYEFLLVGYTPASVNFGNFTLQQTNGNMFLAKISLPPIQTGLFTNKPAKNFHIFPNPTAGNITLSYPPEFADAKVSVYDVSGKLLQNFNHTPSEIRLDAYDPGIYFIIVNKDNTFFTQKIIRE